ncbi:MAG: MFS transporter, partial [Actinomycetota bacterium]
VLLLAAGGWRAIFLVNLPLAAAPLILGCRWIPGRTRVRAPEHFDFPGAFLLTGLLVGTAGLLRSVGGGALGLVGGGALIGLLIFFLRLELRHPDPILQPRLFARASFAGPTGAVAVINLAMYMVLLTVPVLISRRGDLGEGQTGLALAPLLVAAFLSPVGGWIADRLGRRAPALLGLGMSGVSLIPLALAPARISMAVLGGALAATGAGVGLAGAALQMTATESAGQAGAGAAVGVFSASRHFGMVLSASLLGGPLVPHDGGFGGFSTIFLVASGAAFASALLSLPLPGRTALKPKAATHPATGSEGVFSLLS